MMFDELAVDTDVYTNVDTNVDTIVNSSIAPNADRDIDSDVKIKGGSHASATSVFLCDDILIAHYSILICRCTGCHLSLNLRVL